MTDSPEKKVTIFRKFLAAFPVSLFLTLNLYLFTPFTIFQGNTSEFGLSFAPIASNFISSSSILLLFLSGLGALLPRSIHRRYIVFILILGALVWLQGNILVWDYGVLGKGEIDWSKDSWRGIVDGIIWIAALTISVIYGKRLYASAGSTSMIFTGLQLVFLLYWSIQQPSIWSDEKKTPVSPEQIFKFSSNKNVIHFILDELQTDVVRSIIQKDTSRYYEAFSGFTLYQENTGSFPTTVMSVPSFMSGKTYDNRPTIQEFIDTTFKGKTISNVLHDQGYEVDLAASQDWYGYGRHTNWYFIPIPYGVAADEFRKINSTFLWYLTTVRVAPHYLKMLLHEQAAHSPMLTTKETVSYEALRHFSQKAFLQDLIDKMSVDRDKPLYKLIHLTTTHWPIVLNKQCEYAGEILPFTWDNIEIQAKCSLDHFLEFLDRLKELGVYDSAMIIINADHGYWKIADSRTRLQLRNSTNQVEDDFQDEEDFAQKVAANSPMLAVKLPGARGPLRFSESPTSITDIPATINASLGLNAEFPGQPVDQIDSDQIRERRFKYYYDLNRAGDKHFNRIEEYVIRGKARDRNSWKFLSLLLPANISHVTEKLVFGTDEASSFLGFGWSYREMDPDREGLTFTWGVGSASVVYLSLPKSGATLTMNVKTLFKAGTQAVTVKVDGKVVGSWKNLEFASWEKHSVRIGPDESRPAVSTIEFNYSDFLKPNGREYRKLAVLFESITIIPENN